MRINSVTSMSAAYRNMQLNSVLATKALRNISSGYRINSAADDAAGLAISQKMRGQIGGLSMAVQNTQQATSLVQTAEGGLEETSSILTRMKELATQSLNGTYSADDRELMNKEFQNLKGELDRISGATQYNGMNLLDGTLGGKEGFSGVQSLGITNVDITAGSLDGSAKFTISEDSGVYSITAKYNGETITQELDPALNANDVTFSFADGDLQLSYNNITDLQAGVSSGIELSGTDVSYSNAMSAAEGTNMFFQIGANGTADQRMGLHINDMSSLGLGLSDIDILNPTNANDALKAIDNAVGLVNSERANLGATWNRLEFATSSLTTTRDNLVAAESNIRDADLASEIMRYTQRNIMLQASQAMYAQSMNLSQQNMLGLLLMR